MTLLKIGYYSYVLPDEVDIGSIINTLSRLTMVDSVWKNRKYIYYSKPTEILSVEPFNEQVFSSREEAEKHAELSEMDE